MSNFILGLFALSLMAAFTSQSLVDFADTLIVITAVYLSYKNRELKAYFTGFTPAALWPVWLGVVAVGLIVNLGFSDVQTWLNIVEFKWILSLLSIIYLVKKTNFNNKSNNKRNNLFFSSLAGLFLVMNFASIFLYLAIGEARAGGIFNAVMAFSHNIASVFSLFAVLAIVNWSYFNRFQKIIIILLTSSSALLTLLTYTRGVWISSVVGIIVCLFVWNFKRAILFLIGVGLIALVLIFGNQGINNRILSKTAVEKSSNQSRLALWRANWRMIQDYPILGVGHGQNKNHLQKYYDEMGYPPDTLISHAHNQYLQVWAGTGTSGFICYLVFLFSVFKITWQGYKEATEENRGFVLGLMAALLCFVVGALTEANFNISRNRFLFLLLAGVAIGYSQVKEQKTLPQ